MAILFVVPDYKKTDKTNYSMGMEIIPITYSPFKESSIKLDHYAVPIYTPILTNEMLHRLQYLCN